MKYDEIILRDLINIYEKRDANSSNFRTSIKIKITKEKYPKYFGNVTGYDEAIESLVNKGYVTIKKVPHDTVIDSVMLNIDRVEEIKEMLCIDSIAAKRDKLLNELSKYDDEIIIELKFEIENRIKDNKSIKHYLNDDFIDSIKAVHYIENLDHDMYERNASNFIYKDSKRLASLKNIIDSIYGIEDAYYLKGIISVKPYLYIKGEGIVYLNEETIDLNKVKTSIGIPIDDMDSLDFENVKKVTTVENLTTFYDYSSSGIVIYLGGFSTRKQINVLNKIKAVCDNFYHFGDIDYGGFTILNNLMESLNIDIYAINMNLETLMNNIKFAQEFDDDKYIKKLESLLSKPRLKPYYDVIKYLIENHVRLEQESFYNI